MHHQLRIARPTDHLDWMVTMYRDGLRLAKLGRFFDHDGFDGVMLGLPDADWHLEFTHQRGRMLDRSPSEENLLVFYIDDRDAWQLQCEEITRAGFRKVSAHNPYWDRKGTTFEDPDGYRVVLYNAPWAL